MNASIRALRNSFLVSAAADLLLSAAACATGPDPKPTAANPCPPWLEFPADKHSNVETAYLGCSNDANLKATVEDAADLQKGRALGPSNGAREAQTQDQYIAGQRKPLLSAGAQTPSIIFSGSDGGAK